MSRLAFRSIPLAVFLSVAAVAARAADPVPTPTVAVTQPWVRLLPPTAKHTAAFFVIDNHGKRDLKLVAASTDLARGELHNHVMEDGVMKMRPVAAIDLPAGGHATLAPGGLHVMLMDVTRPLVADEVVKLTLRFDDGTTLEVAAPVRATPPQ